MFQVLQTHIPFLVCMAGLLSASFFFACSETAIFNLSWNDLQRLKSSGTRAASATVRLHADRANMIITVLLGNMIVNILFFSMSADLAIHIGESGSSNAELAAFGAVSLFLVIIFGEIIPKVLSISSPQQMSLIVALPMLALHGLMNAIHILPFLSKISQNIEQYLSRRIRREDSVGEKLSAEELKVALDIAADLPQSEKDLINEAIKLDSRTVRELMTPRLKMVYAQSDWTPSQALALAVEHTFHNIPVVDSDIDDIIGVVSINSLYAATNAPGATLADVVKPVKMVPSVMPVTELMMSMHEGRFQFAIVLDEYGQTEGLITMEDCLEAVFGEISDEYDKVTELVERVTPTQTILKGELLVQDWVDRFENYLKNVDFDIDGVLNDDYDTMSGLIITRLQRMPKIGDSVKLGDVTFIVRKVNEPGRGIPIDEFLQIINVPIPARPHRAEAEHAGMEDAP